MAEENESKEEVTTTGDAAESSPSGEGLAQALGSGVDAQAGNAAGTEAKRTGRRAEKIGVVASDKMEKTVVVRVDRLIKHPKYRRYVRRTSKFMAHDEQGATVGDKVRIVETRPLSARKRWRVVEIIQKAAK
jgi:small subunit ribosomal protein S17